jgi:hypothetical protein
VPTSRSRALERPEERLKDVALARKQRRAAKQLERRGGKLAGKGRGVLAVQAAPDCLGQEPVPGACALEEDLKDANERVAAWVVLRGCPVFHAGCAPRGVPPLFEQVVNPGRTLVDVVFEDARRPLCSHPGPSHKAGEIDRAPPVAEHTAVQAVGLADVHADGPDRPVPRCRVHRLGGKNALEVVGQPAEAAVLGEGFPQSAET